MRPGCWLLAATLAVGGCSWTPFDDLKDDVWVDVSTGPAGLPETQYAAAIAAPARSEHGAVFAVAGSTNPTLTRVVYDDNGKRTDTAGDDFAQRFMIVPGGFGTAPAISADPDSQRVGFAAKVSDMTKTQVAVYDLGTDPIQLITNPLLPAQVTAEGFAFAEVGGDATMKDLVITGSGRVDVIVDYEAATPEDRMFACTHQEDASFALGVGKVVAGRDAPVIVVALGSTNRNEGGSKIALIAPEQVQVTQANIPGNCFEGAAALPQFEKGDINDLGEALVVADLDGDGLAEIIAGSPSTGKVFILRDEGGVLVATEHMGQATGFGSALAVADFVGADGAPDGKLDVIVGSPKALVKGAQAGDVEVFEYDATTHELGATPVMTLADAKPSAQQQYGSALAVVPFGGADDHILVIGAHDELFTYFRTLIYADVRAGRQ